MCRKVTIRASAAPWVTYAICILGIGLCAAQSCFSADDYRGFDVHVTSGPLTGQTFSGSLAYDSQSYVIQAFDEHPITDLSFSFQGRSYTETDSLNVQVGFTPTITNSGGSVGGQPVLIYGLSDYFVADAAFDIGFVFTGTTSSLGQYVLESRFTYGNQVRSDGGFENQGEGVVTYRTVPESSSCLLGLIAVSIGLFVPRRHRTAKH
jgi:hypothetical protein